MSLSAFRKGQHVKIGAASFLVLQKLPECRWQLQNTTTGEWCAFVEDDLLDRFARNELSFIVGDRADRLAGTVDRELTSDHPAYLSPDGVALAKNREQYLKEIDRRQPIPITKASMAPLIRAVAERIKDDKPPSWLTLWRNYRQWVAAGRDARAITPRYVDRGKSGTRMVPREAIQDKCRTLFAPVTLRSLLWPRLIDRKRQGSRLQRARRRRVDSHRGGHGRTATSAPATAATSAASSE